MSANSIRAGAAYVELTVDNTLLMRGLKQAQAQLKAFGSTVSSWGRDLAKISAVALAPLALSAHTFSEASSAMARVRGITGATAEEFQALYEQAKRLARDGFFSVKDIAAGMEALGKSGLAAKEIMGAIGPVMGLARIAGSDLPAAAEMAAHAMRAFGLETSDSGHVIDVIAAAARAGKTDVASIAEALEAAGPAARAAGASFEDTAAAIAVLSRNGITGERAAQALVMAYRRLATETIQDKLGGVDTSKPHSEHSSHGNVRQMESRVNISVNSAGAKKALNDLNISVTDVKGNMRSLGDILAELMKKTQDMTQPQRASVFTALFGRGAVAMIDLANGKLDETQKSMQNTEGAAKTMATSMADPLTQAFGRVKTAAEEARIAIGEAIGPTLERWFNELVRVLEGVRRFVSTHQELVVSILKWAAIIGSVGAALIGIGTAAKIAAAAIGGMHSIVTGVISVFTTLASAISALATFIVTPVGAIIAIFGAFATTMFIVSGQAGEALHWLGGVFGQLGQDANATFQGIKDALIAGDFGLAAKILWLGLKMEWQKGIFWLTEWWVAFKEVFVGTATEAFYGAVKVLAGAWDGLRAMWVIIVGFLSNVWQSFTGGIIKAWNVVAGALLKAWTQLKGLFSDKVDVQAETKRIDQETQQKNSAVDAERQRSQQETNDRLARIGQDYESTKSELDKEAEKSKADRQARYQKQLQDAQAERDQAEQEWHDAINKAAQERKAAEAKDKTPDAPAMPAQKKIEASVPAMQMAQERQMEARGTFSSVATWGMGVGSTAERAAKAAEETSKNTYRIMRDVESGDYGAVFD
jgi:hypothetical protein